MESAGDRAQQAGQQMQQAASASQQGQRPQAKQKGEQAEQSLQPLGDELRREKEDMQQAWRQEVVAALDQALAETSRLAERELAVQDQLRSGGDPNGRVRAEQGAIEEGVQRLLEQVRNAGGKNALVSPDIGAALGGAQRQMQRTREAIANATPNAREGAEQAGGAVDALNAAAYQLVRARGDVQGAGSGSGLAEALERMAQLAQQQGGLGQQGAGMLPMAGNGAIREQLRQLGLKQRALAEELQKLRGGGNLPGAGELADEAKDLAEAAGGRTARPAGRRAAGTAVPPDARRGPDAARAKRRTSARNGRARPPPPTACIFRPRSAPSSPATTTGCACRRGRSSSSSRPRSGGSSSTTSAGCPSPGADDANRSDGARPDRGVLARRAGTGSRDGASVRARAAGKLHRGGRRLSRGARRAAGGSRGVARTRARAAAGRPER